MSTQPIPERSIAEGLLDVLIRAGLIVVLVVFCFDIFRPFMSLMLWAVILAVTIYPLDRWLTRKMGNRGGRAATLIVVLGIAIMIVPIYLLSKSMIDSGQAAAATLKEGSFHIPPPADSVANWPLVGETVHKYWLKASTDLTGLAKSFAPQIKSVGATLLGKLAGLGIGLLLFVGALIIAGIIMAFGESGHRASVRIAERLFGPGRGAQIADLCTATIRAVAQGVIGIAFIQMLLVGVAFVLMGIPGAALLCLAVLLLGIVQIPATLITIPVIAFVLMTQGASVTTIVFAIYVFVAGLADNVLKPLLLGRGVSVPMPVILIGAIGGMISNGILGLFIGPVALAVAYQLFWQWVDHKEQDAAASVAPPAVPPAPQTTA